MKPASKIQIMVGLASGRSLDDEVTIKKRVGYEVFNWVVIFGLVSGIISSVAFFLEYLHIDLELALYPVWQFSAFSGALYGIVYLRFSRQKYKQMFNALAEIYEICKNIYETSLENQ